jgi:hypothetical protein
VPEGGEYRSFYTALADDADIHAMSADAFKLLIVLTLSLPVTGIGPVYPSKLCDQVGCDRARLEGILAELEVPRSGRDRGWIVRESNVIWVVNGLASEPSLTPANKKHVPYIRKLAAALDKRLGVVQQFRAKYQPWFAGEAAADGKATDTLSDTVSHTVSKPKQSEAKQSPASRITQEQSNERRDRDLPRPADTVVDPSAPLAGVYAQLPPNAVAFLDKFYPPSRATTARREDVARQIVATLNGGAQFQGQLVRAHSVERLAAKCAAVIRDDVRKPDKAIVILMMKLGDNDANAKNQGHPARSLERAHVILQLAKRHNLLQFHGDSDAYDRRLREAAADPLAGDGFYEEVRPLELWRGIGEQRSDHFAAIEIASRLAAGKVA